MSSRPLAERKPTPVIRQIGWMHRFSGYLEPPAAMWAVEQLLKDIGLLDPAKKQDHLALASSLLRQALVLCPLAPELASMAGQLARFETRTTGASNWIQQVRHFLATLPPENDELETLLTGGAPETSLLESLLQKSNSSPVRFALASKYWQMGEKDLFLETSRPLVSGKAAPFLAPLLAWGAWAAGEPDLARQWLSPGLKSFLSLNLRAEMALVEGDRGRATACWQESLSFEPGQPHLASRLWELAQAAPPADLVASKRVHICLYTFDKLETTLTTLKALLNSDIGPARITLLNNGSTAFGPEDLNRSVRAISPNSQVEIVHLPVNIGAPAARNWLWHLPEVAKADYVAFLDDDVIVPGNWLALYLQDFQDFPDTVVVGPKGLNPGSLATIQYVYRYFQDIGKHKIRFTHNAPNFMDLGQYDMRRPCLSVMGCCHMFDRKKCDQQAIPDFDIRFSPSQVDDLEHDLQVWKAGGRILYDGRVAVIHLQDAGRQAPMTQASWAHVWGNHMKMEYKFSEEELQELDWRVREAEESFLTGQRLGN